MVAMCENGNSKAHTEAIQFTFELNIFITEHISLQKMAQITGLHAFWESNKTDANNSSGTDTEEERCHFKLQKDPAEHELMCMCIYCVYIATSSAYEYSVICTFVHSHTVTITSQNNTYVLCSGVTWILKPSLLTI